MRALTLTQPWASLVADGRKRWETRSWMPGDVGDDVIAIHAAKGWTADDREMAVWCGYDPSTMQRGAIVATARIGRVLQADRATMVLVGQGRWVAEGPLGDYGPERWAWELLDVSRLRVPIPCRGMLGLWTVPDDVSGLLP